ncbi:MAG: hypothetical protein AAF667_16495 [Pseudomonadota bacterium]
MVGASFGFVQNAGAQNLPSNPQLTFGLSSGVYWYDNFDLDVDTLGDSFRQRNIFSVNYLTETPTDTLGLSASTDLRYSDLAGRETSFEFEDPSAALSYDRVTANADLGVNLRFDRIEVSQSEGFDLDDAGLPGQDLVRDQGNRDILNLVVNGEFGKQDPFGGFFSGRYTDRSFSDTTDPDLFDSETRFLQGGLRFRVSPAVEVNAFGSASLFEADDSTSSETERYTLGVGADLRVRSDTTVNLSLANVDITETDTIGTTEIEEEENDFEVAAGWQRDVTNGTLSLNYTRSVAIEGARDALTFGRNLTLPSGSFGLTLGASNTAGDEIFAVGAVDYIRTLQDSELLFRLSQDVRTTDDSDEVLTTNLDLGYSRNLNQVSSFRANVRVSEVTDTGVDTQDDRTFASLVLRYTRELTADWGLTLGYEARSDREDDEDRATSNSVFLTLDRVWRVSP